MVKLAARDREGRASRATQYRVNASLSVKVDDALPGADRRARPADATHRRRARRWHAHLDDRPARRSAARWFRRSGRREAAPDGRRRASLRAFRSSLTNDPGRCTRGRVEGLRALRPASVLPRHARLEGAAAPGDSRDRRRRARARERDPRAGVRGRDRSLGGALPVWKPTAPKACDAPGAFSRISRNVVSARTRRLHFETRAIHAGQEPDAATGATIVPVYQTATFTQDADRGAPRLRVLAQRQPDARGARDLPRRARGRALRPRLRLGHGRHRRRHAAALGRRSRRRRGRSLRRQPPALHAGAAALRRALQLRRRDATRGDRRRRSSPRRACSGSRARRIRCCGSIDIAACARDRAPRAARWLVVDNTFATPFLQNPLALGAHVVRALHHQVHRRPLGRDRRRRRAWTTRSSAKRLRFTRNATGGVPGPVGRLAHAARREDAGACACASTRRNAPAVADVPARVAREIARVHYPGLPGSSRPRARAPPDARLRRHGHDRAARRRSRGAQALRSDAALLARREPRRRRVADRLPVDG